MALPLVTMLSDIEYLAIFKYSYRNIYLIASDPYHLTNCESLYNIDCHAKSGTACLSLHSLIEEWLSTSSQNRQSVQLIYDLPYDPLLKIINVFHQYTLP